MRNSWHVLQESQKLQVICNIFSRIFHSLFVRASIFEEIWSNIGGNISGCEGPHYCHSQPPWENKMYSSRIKHKTFLHLSFFLRNTGFCMTSFLHFHKLKYCFPLFIPIFISPFSPLQPPYIWIHGHCFLPALEVHQSSYASQAVFLVIVLHHTDYDDDEISKE